MHINILIKTIMKKYLYLIMFAFVSLGIISCEKDDDHDHHDDDGHDHIAYVTTS